LDLGELLAYVANLVATLLGEIGASISQSIIDVRNYVGNLVSGVVASLHDLLAGIVPTIVSAVEGIISALQDALKPVLTVLQEIVTAIEGTVKGLLEEISGLFSSLWEKVQGIVQSIMGSVKELADSLASEVSALYKSIVDGVSGFIDTVVGAVKDFIKGVYDQLAQGASSLWEGIKAGFNEAIQFVQQVWDTIVSHVQQAWEQLVTGADSIIKSINDRIASFGADVSKQIGEGIGAFEKFAEGAVQPLIDQILEFLKPFTTFFDPAEFVGLEQFFTDVVSPNTLAVGNRAGFERLMNATFPKSPLARIPLLLVFFIFVGPFVLKGIVDANAKTLLQDYAMEHPFEVMSPADVATAVRHNNLDTPSGVKIIQASGFGEADANTLIQNSENVPPPGDLLALWLRQEIDDATLEKSLNYHGLTGDWVTRLRRLSSVIPPIDDILRMARRLVFDESVVSKYELLGDYSTEAEKWAGFQGLSVAWAKNYWAAHWDVPSVQQGFEMFQRQVISADDLNFLMRDAAVAPFWRQRLTQVAYHPFTRVDIRRMHKVGTLTDDDLVKAYRDIGYSPENAAVLRDFTIKLNAGSKGKGDAALGALTKNSILTFYNDGLINADKALSLLTGIGVTPDAAALYIANADVVRHAAERKAKAAAIIEEAHVGHIDSPNAIAQLQNLGLTQTELDREMLALDRALSKAIKLPEHALLNELLLHKQIDDATYLSTLRSHGFSTDWANKILASEKAKLATAKKP
jgi:uncharacterized protein Yka (UPF0111/DUF47 family)